MDSAALAFDRAAARYDADFGPNPAGRLFRYVFQERLLALFPEGSSLLDLGCGTGEDALLLAARGRRVLGVDAAPAMVAEARRKAEAAGLGGAARFEERRLEDLAGLAQRYDGAYSDFGALNCADPAALGRGLARVLRPGAPLLLSVMGPRPLPLSLRRLLTGRGAPRAASPPAVAGVALPVSYPWPGELRRRLGPEFAWSGGFALGLLVPGPELAGWAARHAQAFGLLAIAESLVRRWPLLRALGDHDVLEGVRR